MGLSKPRPRGNERDPVCQGEAFDPVLASVGGSVRLCDAHRRGSPLVGAYLKP